MSTKMAKPGVQQGPGRPVQDHAVERRFRSGRRWSAVECRCGKVVVGIRGAGKHTAEFDVKQAFSEHKAENAS